MGDSSASSKRVKLRDGRFLAYREVGVSKDAAKFKIILVHGFRSSKNMNFSVSNELIEELGVYLLFYDRSGYGESDSNAKSLKREADDIEELADLLEIGPKFYIIGISLGAYPTWGCLKHIPHRLSGVAFVAPTVNYRWPSLPEKLINKDCRRIFINLCLMISEHAPGLLHWRVFQYLIQSTSSVLRSNVVYLNSFQDMKVLKRPTVTPTVTKNKDDVWFDTIRDDFVACFEQWDFEPADLSIGKESCVHIWHGKKDPIVPFQLIRCILQKQPLINYHEMPHGGHMIAEYDGTGDAILRALLLGKEEMTSLERTV